MIEPINVHQYVFEIEDGTDDRDSTSASLRINSEPEHHSRERRARGRLATRCAASASLSRRSAWTAFLKRR